MGCKMTKKEFEAKYMELVKDKVQRKANLDHMALCTMQYSSGTVKYIEERVKYSADVMYDFLVTNGIITEPKATDTCPKCWSNNVLVERRPDGFCVCVDCGYKWENKGVKEVKE